MKNRLINLLLGIFFLSLALMSCQDKVEGYLKSLDKKSLFNNNPEGWKIFQYIESMNQYMVFKYDGDTLKYMRFIPDENNLPIISDYEMKFPCGNLDTCFLRMQAMDTLFYYKQNELRKEFIIGEYAFWYTSTQMNKEERDFYEKHEDSLRSIKGNNLPNFINKEIPNK
jgi:hypothetical protein